MYCLGSPSTALPAQRSAAPARRLLLVREIAHRALLHAARARGRSSEGLPLSRAPCASGRRSRAFRASGVALGCSGCERLPFSDVRRVRDRYFRASVRESSSLSNDPHASGCVCRVFCVRAVASVRRSACERLPLSGAPCARLAALRFARSEPSHPATACRAPSLRGLSLSAPSLAAEQSTASIHRSRLGRTGEIAPGKRTRKPHRPRQPGHEPPGGPLRLHGTSPWRESVSQPPTRSLPGVH